MNLRTFSPAGWAIIAAVAAILLFGGWWFVTAPGRAAVKAAKAEVAATFSDARMGSAVEANQIGGQARGEAATSETLSQETAHAIQAAPGAQQRLDPALNRVARERVCLRPAYRERPECKLLQPGS